MKEMKAVSGLFIQPGTGENFFDDDTQPKAELWKLRHRTAEAVKLDDYLIEEDAGVSRAELPDLIEETKKSGNRNGFYAVFYGYTCDDNLHIRIK